MISWRQLLAIAGAAPAWAALKTAAGAQNFPKPGGIPPTIQVTPKMVGTVTAFALRFRASQASKEPFDMIEHCGKTDPKRSGE